MDAILSWVKQIVMFYIFVNFIMHVLPNGRYVKYIKFFAGILLIIIVLSPVTSFFNLDNLFTSIYNSTVSKYSLNGMKIDLQYAENSGYDQITEPYKQEIIKKTEEIILENHLYPVETQVVFNLDKDSEEFGQIESITAKVSKKYASEDKIIIEKISVELGVEIGNKNNLSLESVNIKNSLSEFYEIPISKISVTETF